jgi:threonine dehydrogenase-like Zn-dependent dehydrogenase
MRATVFHGVEDVRVDEVPDARLEQPTDAVVRVTHSAVSGLDVRQYRGLDPCLPGQLLGREFVGVVEEIGEEVRAVRRGDYVVAPSEWTDGAQEVDADGMVTPIGHTGRFGDGGGPGGQAEAVRVPFASTTLVPLPAHFNAELLPSAVTLCHVMSSGHHAATAAGVRYRDTVAVVGDGATALCGVLAAARRGAERIIALLHHEERVKIARRFAATDLVGARGDDAVKAVLDLTGGRGVDAVLECAGTAEAWRIATAIVRDGGTIGHVGLPSGEGVADLTDTLRRRVTVRGGSPPTRAYIPRLLADLIRGRIEPSAVFTAESTLVDVPDAYAELSARRTIKTLIETS